MCDSGVAVFDENGKKIFLSPFGWSIYNRCLPKDAPDTKDQNEQTRIRHRFYRNMVTPEGELVGYGVVTGEEAALKYLNKGTLKIIDNSLIFLFTDGFENYFSHKDFIKIFSVWPDNLNDKLGTLISKYGVKDPSKYGLEKTLIAIKI